MGMRHHAFFYSVSHVPTGLSFGFFPVSQEFLLGYSQTVPTGLSFGFFPVSQEFLLGYSQTVPTGLTCPSCDPMRGVSSSVMHKVHRTKMYKLQKAPRCCFYRRHGILAALDLVFVWHISFCRLLWYAWDCIVGGFGVRARRAGIQRREPVRRGSEM